MNAKALSTGRAPILLSAIPRNWMCRKLLKVSQTWLSSKTEECKKEVHKVWDGSKNTFPNLYGVIVILSVVIKRDVLFSALRFCRERLSFEFHSILKKFCCGVQRKTELMTGIYGCVRVKCPNPLHEWNWKQAQSRISVARVLQALANAEGEFVVFELLFIYVSQALMFDFFAITVGDGFICLNFPVAKMYYVLILCFNAWQSDWMISWRNFSREISRGNFICLAGSCINVRWNPLHNWQYLSYEHGFLWCLLWFVARVSYSPARVQPSNRNNVCKIDDCKSVING